MALEDALVLARLLRTHGSPEESCQRSSSDGVLASVGCNSERTAGIV